MKDVLIELGLDAQDGKDVREDIILVHNGSHFVFEVKGLTKSAGEKDINQLQAKKMQYEQENKVKAKGVLIVNAWRELPLEDRNTPDHPIFPNQMMVMTNIWEFCLMTTQQLFVLYCMKLEKVFKLNEFLLKLNRNWNIE